MIVTSNAIYLNVYAPPAQPGTGWQLKVRDPDFYYYPPIAEIYEWTALTVGVELNATGAAQVTFDLDSPFWSGTLQDGRPATALLDRVYWWEAYEDGELRFEFLGSNVEEAFVDASETRVATVSGPGMAQLLARAVIFRPGWPAPVPSGLNPQTAVSSSDMAPTLGWEFPADWSTMRMWWTMFDSALTRFASDIQAVNPLFTDFVDSAGNPWQYIPTVQTVSGYGYRPTPGMNLLDFLNECTGQDPDKYFGQPVEWFMRPGRNLEVRPTIGVHREKQVVFWEGSTLTKHRNRVRDDIYNYIVVVDVNGDTSTMTSTRSIAKWGRREQLQDKNQNITEGSRRNFVAGIYMQMQADEKSEWTIQVPYSEPQRRPFIDYDIGDWIGIAQYTPGRSSVVDPYRILAITISVDADGQPTVELTLQSKLDSLQQNLQREMTRVLNTPKDENFVSLPYPPSDPSTIIAYPDGSFGYGDIGSDFAGGLGGGTRVFIQQDDPGDAAKVGDFWYDLSTFPEPDLDYIPDPEPAKPPIEDTTKRIRIPGTRLMME